jgi:hypothetical protein
MEYHVEVFYRFKKKKMGVCLGMKIEADDSDDAIDKAKAHCVGPRWPARIYSHASVTESN